MNTASDRQVAPETGPLLVTVSRAAELLSIGRTSVYELVWSGELTPIRIGRSVRFAVDELEAFVRSKRNP